MKPLDTLGAGVLFLLTSVSAIGQEKEVYEFFPRIRITIEGSNIQFSGYNENDEYFKDEFTFTEDSYRDFDILRIGECSFVRIQSDNWLFLLSPSGKVYHGAKRSPMDRAPTEGHYLTLGHIEASSFLVEQLGSMTVQYPPERLLDWDISSGWVEGTGDNGIGETLEFSLRNKSITSGLFFFNGFLDPGSLDLYYQNARLKDFAIEVDSGNVYEFRLEDKPGEQAIYLPEKSHRFVLVVKSVYPGDNYQDLAISGIFANVQADYFELRF